ncbi:hypothetical protein Tco_1420118 [Tanacetum coccineum]
MASSGSSDITISSEEGKKKVPRKGKNPEQSKQRQKAKTIALETICVFYYSKGKAKSKKEAAIYGERRKRHDGWELGDEGLSSGGTKLNSIFITAEVTFTKPIVEPGGGGLILYQAYGNLYVMAGRKAHLLEDKQIPTLGWLLEEIHVALSHLEKKQTRLRLYTKSLEEYAYSAWRRRHILL